MRAGVRAGRRPGAADAGAPDPPLRAREPRRRHRFRLHRLHAAIRTELHRHPQHARPRGAAGALQGPHRPFAARRGGRSLRLQPRADLGVHRPVHPRRGGGGQPRVDRPLQDRQAGGLGQANLPAPRRADRGHLRPLPLRRQLPGGRHDRSRHPAGGCARPGPEADRQGFRRRLLPEGFRRALHRDGARPRDGRGAARVASADAGSARRGSSTARCAKSATPPSTGRRTTCATTPATTRCRSRAFRRATIPSSSRF